MLVLLFVSCKADYILLIYLYNLLTILICEL